MAYQYKVFPWTVSGPPHFYEVHGHGSFPSKTDRNPHSQLPRRLARSDPVECGAIIAQNPHSQGQFHQEHAVPQPANIVPGNRSCSGHAKTQGLLQEWHLSPHKSVSDDAGPNGWEPTSLPERVLNTISEARAPSSRCLYALKWSIFSTWCLDRGEDPSTFELSVVLSFLQELLHKRRSPSTLKVFVAGLPCPYSRPIDLSAFWGEPKDWIRLGPSPSLHGICLLCWGPWRCYSLRTLGHCH